MITREAAVLMVNDALRAPVKGGKVVNHAVAKRVEKMEDELLARAKREILFAVPDAQINIFSEQFATAWEQAHGANILPGISAYADSDVDKGAEVDQQSRHLGSIHTNLLNTAITANKLEKQLELHYGGYVNRDKLLRQKIVDASEAIAATKRDLDCFRTLQVHEGAGIVRRLETLSGEVEYLEKKEKEAQGLFRRRKEELDRLLER